MWILDDGLWLDPGVWDDTDFWQDYPLAGCVGAAAGIGRARAIGHSEVAPQMTRSPYPAVLDYEWVGRSPRGRPSKWK